MPLNIVKENDFSHILQRGKTYGRIIGTENILSNAVSTGSADQLLNMGELPGAVSMPIGLPDIHRGYGFPIGSVIAMDAESGVVSPGGVGYDINCGVTLLATGIDTKTMRRYTKPLLQELKKNIPVGIARSREKLSESQIRRIVDEGVYWMYELDMATEEDILRTEYNGHLFGVESSSISEEAYKRGMNYFGTLGSGNHFLEIQSVEDVYDEMTAQDYGISNKMTYVMIHTGSRGIGHQVATDYLEQIRNFDHNKNLKDPQLSYIELGTKLADSYISAMNGAANYAFCNRQFIINRIREAFSNVMKREFQMEESHIVYSISHNMATFEEHEINGKRTKALVHRKGATRADGPEFDRGYFMNVGHPVLVPGSMGSSSYVIRGKMENESLTIGSCCHGAGRIMGRKSSRENLRKETILSEMESLNIDYLFGNEETAVEEGRESYKDIEEVYNSIIGSGIGSGVARLFPMGVLKG